MDRLQKSQALASLKEDFAGASSVVIAHYRGMSVAEITALRNKARESGVRIKITKNTLAKIASSDTEFKGLSSILSGPTALAIANDEISAAKAIAAYADENEKLIIVGGFADGRVLDVAGIQSLASMPTLDESRAKLVGLLQAPAAALVGLLQAPGGQVARVLSARGAQAE